MQARRKQLPHQLQGLWSDIPAWTATMLFMFQPVAQSVSSLLMTLLLAVTHTFVYFLVSLGTCTCACSVALSQLVYTYVFIQTYVWNLHSIIRVAVTSAKFTCSCRHDLLVCSLVTAKQHPWIMIIAHVESMAVPVGVKLQKP